MKPLEEFCTHILNNLFDGVYFLDKNKKITFWNKSAEQLTGFSSEEAIANYYCCNMLEHVDENGESMCESWCPISLTLGDGLTREAQVFLRHKDGHRLPVSVRVFSLKDEAGAIAGAVQVFSDNSVREALCQELEQLKDKANFDQLTGMYTRRFGEIVLVAKLAEYQQDGRAVGLLFADIDNFKNVNDIYGHIAGDLVLKTVAKTLVSNVRLGDYVIRWGGEEIIIVLSGHFDSKGLERVANKLRALVQQSEVHSGQDTIKVTISFGATLATKNDTVETLVHRADNLMYQSKKAGRNQVTVG